MTVTPLLCCGNVTNKYAVTGEWRTGNDGNYQGSPIYWTKKGEGYGLADD